MPHMSTIGAFVMVHLFIKVQLSGSGQLQQLYSQERETNIHLMKEIEQLRKRLEHASLAGREIYTCTCRVSCMSRCVHACVCVCVSVCVCVCVDGVMVGGRCI